MRTRTFLGSGVRGIGLIERSDNKYVLIAHFDSKGFFSGFVNSLSFYSELRPCRVDSLVSINNNKYGVDLYQNGESTYLPDVTMIEAMASAKAEKPDSVLYRVGKIDNEPFKQVFYIHLLK